LPSPTPLHGIVRDRIARLIGNYFDRNAIGGAISEIDCRVNDETVRRPHLAIFFSPNWTQLDLKKVPIPFAPDIAVEVLSPSEIAIDVNRKVREYLSSGSQEVWLLDPENTELLVRTKTGIRSLQKADNLESPLLPGFSVAAEIILASR
jgi:Uma2 family endonuclease